MNKRKWCVHTVKYYSAMKRNEVLIHVPHYACEKNQTQKATYLTSSTYMNYTAYWAERRGGSEEQLLNGFLFGG